MSPGGACGLQASPGLCPGAGGVGCNAVLGVSSRIAGDLATRGPTLHGAETLLGAHLGHRTDGDGVSRGPFTSMPPRPARARRGRCPGCALPKAPACLPLAFLPVWRSPGAALSVLRLGQPFQDRQKPGEAGLSLPAALLAGFLPALSSPTQSADTHLQSPKEHSAPTERPRVPRIAPFPLLGFLPRLCLFSTLWAPGLGSVPATFSAPLPLV